MCRHEMERAIALDPAFSRQLVLPVRRDDTEPPPIIAEPHALRVDLRNDGDAQQWQLLLDACGANLGTTAPGWLAARDEILRLFERRYCINLVVKGPGVAWRGLIEDLRMRATPKLGYVDLEDPATVSRRGLLAAMLGALGSQHGRPATSGGFAGIWTHTRLSRPFALRAVFISTTCPTESITAKLFSSLRYLIMEKRQLVLLIQSRTPFSALLPRGHPLSAIDIRTVELQAHS